MPDDNLRRSAALHLREIRLSQKTTMRTYVNGRNRLLLSIFSGSVMSGKNAAPPSLLDTTNLTADHTAILENGVTSGLRPLPMRIRSPDGQISSVPEF